MHKFKAFEQKEGLVLQVLSRSGKVFHLFFYSKCLFTRNPQLGCVQRDFVVYSLLKNQWIPISASPIGSPSRIIRVALSWI